MGARSLSLTLLGVFAALLCAARSARAQPTATCPGGQVASPELGACVPAAECPPGFAAIDSLRCIETVVPVQPMQSPPFYQQPPTYPYAPPQAAPYPGDQPRPQYRYASPQSPQYRYVLPSPEYASAPPQPIVIHLNVLAPIQMYVVAPPPAVSASYEDTRRAPLRRGGARRSAGLAVWLAGYGVSALTGLWSSSVPAWSGASSWFFVPVIGPIVGGLSMDARPGSSFVSMTMVGVVETAVQFTGLLLVLASARSHGGDDEDGYRPRHRRPRRGEWALAPSAAPGYAGVSFTARGY